MPTHPPFIPKDAPRWVTANRLAAYLGVSPHTIYRWVRVGIIPPPRRLGPRMSLFNVRQMRRALRGKFEEQPPDGKNDAEASGPADDSPGPDPAAARDS